jgi:hypothetical protein
MQIQGKIWATDSCLAGLVRAFNFYLRPQETLCSWGTGKTITKTQIDQLIATADDDYYVRGLPRDP